MTSAISIGAARRRAAMVAAALVALSVATSCAPAPRSAERAPLPTYADGAAPDCRNTAMRVEIVGEQPGPPRSYVFDLVLRNPSASTRWLVLPRSFPNDGKPGPAPGIGAVVALDADVQSGRGRATIVKAYGPGGFQAVYLPGGAVVHLRDVTIEAPWDTAHAIARFPVIVARDVSLEDRPITTWLSDKIASDADADVRVSATPRDRMPNRLPKGEHPAAFAEDCRATAQAILTRDPRR